jgi:hypothetical protein
MTETTGWRRLESSRPADGRRPGEVSGFTRLARTHALLVAGDTLLALALAGSLFFSIDPSAARWRVGLYLLLTMAPFAVVSPLIGPALDRAAGGRRMVVIVSGFVRAVVAVMMFRHLDSLLLFPEAFLMLVLGKSYHVAKSAIVPGMVDTDDELVAANARLSLLSGVAGALVVIPASAILWLGGPRWVCLLCAVAFAVGGLLATRLPRSVVADEPASADEVAELRGAGIRLAASAMGLLRGIVGFLTFLIAFTLRGSQETPFVSEFGSHVGAATREAIGQASTTLSTGSPTWYFGVAAAMAGLGAPVGALVTPRLRRTVPEERIIVGALALAVVVGFLAALVGGLGGAALMAFVVAIAGSGGKLAFDSIVQRDAPDANRGRSFARFETRFQLIWVVGAAIPVLVPIPGRIGYLMISIVAAFAVVSYALGYRFLEAHGRLRPNRTTERIKAEASRRARRVGQSARSRLRRDGTDADPPDDSEVR